jgi:ATP phosphoribosyltransferase regulatory subunit HisZ
MDASEEVTTHVPPREISDVLNTLAALLIGTAQITKAVDAVTSNTFTRSDLMERVAEVRERAAKHTIVHSQLPTDA